MFKYSKHIFSSSPLLSINHSTHALARHVTPIAARQNRILAVWRMFSGRYLEMEARNGEKWFAPLKGRAMLIKRERIPVTRVIFIINPIIISFAFQAGWNERWTHQSWREGKRKREKRDRGRVSERIPKDTPPLLSSFLPLSLSFSLSFFFNVSTKRSKIEVFSVYDNVVYPFFERPSEAAVVSRPVARPFGSNALFFDQENCHVLSPSRKEESNFLAFLTPSFQSLDKPADRRTNDPFPPFFLSSFFIFLAPFHPRSCHEFRFKARANMLSIMITGTVIFSSINNFNVLFRERGIEV